MERSRLPVPLGTRRRRSRRRASGAAALVPLALASGLVLPGCSAGPGATVGPAASPLTTTSSPVPALPSPTWTRTVGDTQALMHVAHAAHALGYAYTGEATMIVRVPAGRSLPDDRAVGPVQVHFAHSRFTAASAAALEKRVGDAFDASWRSGEKAGGSFGYEPVNDVISVEGVLPKALTEAPPDSRLVLVPGSAPTLDSSDESSSGGAADPTQVTARPAGRPTP
ncbi:hypothetical protein [Luteimicrobium sp. DT211]|uniref:hypothetical protein n=1 Tax=Luteimicrobium sp. DT211 TaxID=3393412 RepID=UPI003CEC248A